MAAHNLKNADASKFTSELQARDMGCVPFYIVLISYLVFPKIGSLDLFPTSSSIEFGRETRPRTKDFGSNITRQR